jgi:hypothetical protein
MRTNAEGVKQLSIAPLLWIAAVSLGAGLGCGSSEESSGSNGGRGAAAGKGGAGETSGGQAGTTSDGGTAGAGAGAGSAGAGAGGGSGAAGSGSGGASAGSAGAAGATAGSCADCGETQYCVLPCCGGQPICTPAPASGACPAGTRNGCTIPCVHESGCCEQICMPGPPTCSDTIPIGCYQRPNESSRVCQLTCA